MSESSKKTPFGGFLQNMDNFGTNAQGYTADMRTGGQLGLGRNFATLDTATPLAFPPALVFMLQGPTMFNSDPEMLKMLKNIVECCAKSWTGIDVEYTIETADAQAGMDGQMQATPTTHKRTQPSPSATFDEVTGNLIWGCMHKWMLKMKDPDTNGALMGTGDTVEPYVMSTYSMTLLIIQPDMTMRPENIIDASIITNVFPTSPGPLGIQRTIGTTEIKERNVQFTGMLLHNSKIRDAAVTYMKNLMIHTVNYDEDLRGIDDNLLAGTYKDEGLKKVVDDYSNQA